MGDSHCPEEMSQAMADGDWLGGWLSTEIFNLLGSRRDHVTAVGLEHMSWSDGEGL